MISPRNDPPSLPRPISHLPSTEARGEKPWDASTSTELQNVSILNATTNRKTTSRNVLTATDSATDVATNVTTDVSTDVATDATDVATNVTTDVSTDVATDATDVTTGVTTDGAAKERVRVRLHVVTHELCGASPDATDPRGVFCELVRGLRDGALSTPRLAGHSIQLQMQRRTSIQESASREWRRPLQRSSQRCRAWQRRRGWRMTRRGLAQ